MTTMTARLHPVIASLTTLADGRLGYKFPLFSDPSHGWVRVPRPLLAELGIATKVTGYSYQRGAWVYLEEDCDLQTLHDALQAREIPYTIIHERQTKGPSSIRKFDRYTNA